MTSAAELVKDARRQSGLPLRVVAARAGVSVSTITRIESGRMDPTVGMLHRLVAATGQHLVLGTAPDDDAPPPQTVAEVAARWRRAPGRGPADWTCLQSFTAHLAAHPDEVAPAIGRSPGPTGSATLDDVLAGVARQLADEAGLPRPGWAQRRPPTGVGRGPV